MTTPTTFTDDDGRVYVSVEPMPWGMFEVQPLTMRGLYHALVTARYRRPFEPLLCALSRWSPDARGPRSHPACAAGRRAAMSPAFASVDSVYLGRAVMRHVHDRQMQRAYQSKDQADFEEAGKTRQAMSLLDVLFGLARLGAANAPPR